MWYAPLGTVELRECILDDIFQQVDVMWPRRCEIYRALPMGLASPVSLTQLGDKFWKQHHLKNGEWPAIWIPVGLLDLKKKEY